MMQGFGVYEWKDGRKYEGQYLKNKKHGQGKYTYSDGSIYEGGWDNGFQHGKGTLTDGKTKEKRKGKWSKGVLE